MRNALGFSLAFVSGLCIGAVVNAEWAKARAQSQIQQAIDVTQDIHEQAAKRAAEKEVTAEEVVEYKEIVTRYQVEPQEENTGIHHISDIDYNDDEDYEKNIVEIFVVDEVATIVINGTEVQDWYTHLGPTIVLTGDESMDNETFYVRNHVLRCDYEVTWGKP